MVFLLFLYYLCAAAGMMASNDAQAFHETAEVIPNEYVIVLKENAPIIHTMDELCTVEMQCASSIRITLRNVINGRQFITISGDDTDVGSFVRNPFVKTVGPNVRIVAFKTTESIDVDKTETPTTMCISQNVTKLWGLDRLDQREGVSSNMEYIYGVMDEHGADVNAYVVDSGVDVTNTEFDGRAVWGFTADDVGSDQDLNGHGTHVAGTIGAATYGVAKESFIIAVKVLNSQGLGSASGLISGLEWLVNDYNRRGKPHSVVNLSLGFNGISESVDDAVQAVVDAGIPVVVAAGNSNADACGVTPAHISDVITVGAHDVKDTTANFSNWGTCLDIWAPGKDILSITPLYPWVLSGTSMASPHVAGVIARYLGTMTSTKPSVAEVAHWLDSMSTRDYLTFDDDQKTSSPNKMAFIDCARSWTTPVMTTTTGANPQLMSSHCCLCVTLLWCLINRLMEAAV
ncbi:hypothetical protein LSH36_1524g00033 [Paralvinella palmiformis]|uniref:Peptidase S8/S53 domain-containing protein n=1 Tax=Paralvinella palmiformis TaxID=53620 RepID=A0AAD9MNP2_9ANNE|nr:hypothetical protein LSH36_1524g00033 [Paralvinella palmiformis]